MGPLRESYEMNDDEPQLPAIEPGNRQERRYQKKIDRAERKRQAKSKRRTA